MHNYNPNIGTNSLPAEKQGGEYLNPYLTMSSQKQVDDCVCFSPIFLKITTELFKLFSSYDKKEYILHPIITSQKFTEKCTSFPMTPDCFNVLPNLSSEATQELSLTC